MLLLIACLVFAGCKKDELPSKGFDTPPKSKSLIFSEVDEGLQDSLLHIFAKSLAVAQTDAAFRQYLENSVKSAPDGKATILMVDHRQASIGLTDFASILSVHSLTAGVQRSAAFFSDTLLQVIPNLTVTVHPGENNDDDIDNWTYNDAPLFVMPVTQLFDSDEETMNIAYGPNGQTNYYSNQQDPLNPVVIVQAHSHYIPVEVATGRIKGGHSVVKTMIDCPMIWSTIQNLLEQVNNNPPAPPYILFELGTLMNIYNNHCQDPPPPPPPPPGPDPSATICDGQVAQRDSRECREMITTMKYLGDKTFLNKFCPWKLLGYECVIGVDVTKATLPAGTNEGIHIGFDRKFARQKRRHMKRNKQFSPDLPLYKWEFKQDLHGDRYRITFTGLHPDAGQETTWSFSFSTKVGFKVKDPITLIEYTVEHTVGGSRSIKKTAKDESLGGETIYYCDKANPPGENYTNNLLEFNVIEIVTCN